MSGHSKWANIKHRKNSQDKKKAKIFGKLSQLIATAVKESGGDDDPATNAHLRQVIERAKEANMPKKNVKRAIENAVSGQDGVKSSLLEAYGPAGSAFLIQIVTDNRQRTVQKVRSLLERNNGKLAEPGAVAYQFNQVGKIVLTDCRGEETILKLIDWGADDMEQKEKGEVVVWISPDLLTDFSEQVTNNTECNLKSKLVIFQPERRFKLKGEDKEKFLELKKILENYDDIDNIYTNVDINEK